MFPADVKHFKAREWRHDPDRVSPDLVLSMDGVREKAGVPIRINQAWDTDGHVPGSGHYDDPATAVDFAFLGLTYRRQLDLLDEAGFSGIGFYPDWQMPGWHADQKARPVRAFWVCRKGQYAYYRSAEELAVAMGWHEAAPAMAHVDLIHTVSARHGLPWELVLAMVRQESGGNQHTVRFEPEFFRRYIDGRELGFRPEHCSKATEAYGRAFSWGLLHIMGETAREQGFSGWFPELCDPETGLEWGCRYLADLRRRFGGEGWPVVVRAYNAGSGGRNNQDNNYPGEVLEKLGGRWPDESA